MPYVFNLELEDVTPCLVMILLEAIRYWTAVIVDDLSSYDVKREMFYG